MWKIEITASIGPLGVDAHALALDRAGERWAMAAGAGPQLLVRAGSTHSTTLADVRLPGGIEYVAGLAYAGTSLVAIARSKSFAQHVLLEWRDVAEEPAERAQLPLDLAPAGLCASSDGKVVCVFGRTVQLIELSSGAVRRQWSSATTSARFHAAFEGETDTLWIAEGTAAEIVRYAPDQEGPVERLPAALPEPVKWIDTSPDGQYSTVSHTGSSGAIVHDRKSGTAVVPELVGPKKPSFPWSFSPDGEWLIGGGSVLRGLHLRGEDDLAKIKLEGGLVRAFAAVARVGRYAISLEGGRVHAARLVAG